MGVRLPVLPVQALRSLITPQCQRSVVKLGGGQEPCLELAPALI